MSEMIHITAVEVRHGFEIRVAFADGAVRDIDLSDLIGSGGGVFTPIAQSRAVFKQVRVNPQTRTVEWPGEVDLDPEVLYGRFEPASGARIKRRTVREPQATFG